MIVISIGAYPTCAYHYLDTGSLALADGARHSLAGGVDQRHEAEEHKALLRLGVDGRLHKNRTKASGTDTKRQAENKKTDNNNKNAPRRNSVSIRCMGIGVTGNLDQH